MTDASSEVSDEDGEAIDRPQAVQLPTIRGLPEGYTYGVTRYADVILEQVFPARLRDLEHSLETYSPQLDELIEGGGGRTAFTARFDESLHAQTVRGQEVWGKRNITIAKAVSFDGAEGQVSRVRGHEIDMFGVGSINQPFPGIAVEMEWNNKDPFFDRDLNNFAALHREGAIAVGVIVTRSPRLQYVVERTISTSKYGRSTTHWDKLVPKVNLGGGGECPLFLIGIDPDRIEGIERAYARLEDIEKADDFRAHWRELGYRSWLEAKADHVAMLEAARPL